MFGQIFVLEHVFIHKCCSVQQGLSFEQLQKVWSLKLSFHIREDWPLEIVKIIFKFHKTDSPYDPKGTPIQLNNKLIWEKVNFWNGLPLVIDMPPGTHDKWKANRNKDDAIRLRVHFYLELDKFITNQRNQRNSTPLQQLTPT